MQLTFLVKKIDVLHFKPSFDVKHFGSDLEF
jgi:hypothetical protein